jgi:quercetin dioxygenase-like cupin family protein
MTIPVQPQDLASGYLVLSSDGAVSALEAEPGPPPQVPGVLIGAPLMTANAPHAGEIHPDGDEVLYVVSGGVDVVLEEPGGDRAVPVAAGEAFVVPRGIWHRVLLREPTRLLHLTPGPGSRHRPLEGGAAQTR